MNQARALVAILLAASARLAFGQGVPLPDLKGLHTDVTVSVYKHPIGADMVTLTVLDPDFPPEVLSREAAEIGGALGTPIRGLKLSRELVGPKGAPGLLSASFATNGILNGERGIKLQPIVRSLAGGTGHAKVSGIDVILRDVKTSPNMIKDYASDAVIVRAADSPEGILNYRIELLAQDPGRVVIPDLVEEPKPTREVTVRRSSMAVIWILVGLGAIAVGAIVYNLALRVPKRTR